MNPLLAGITNSQNNSYQGGDTLQEVFAKMMTGQIDPREFMLNKINSFSQQEKTRFRVMLNNGVFRNLFRSFGISDSQYMDFVKSIKL